MGKMIFLAVLGATLATPAILSSQTNGQQQPPSASSPADEEIAAKISKVKRVYIEGFGDDATSRQAQAIVIDAITNSHRFIVTESREKADAILKGVATEKTSQELHATSEGTIVQSAGIANAEASTQTINDARLVVRLVSSDGDVLWSTTQESKGAKYKGASADVAEKVVKQLLWDLDKLQSRSKPKPSNQP